MTPQHIILAAFAASFVSALAMFYWCEFGKGGVRATRNELDAEVELNVKLLKEKYDWILERANFRRTLSDPIKLAEILELAKSVDTATATAVGAPTVDGDGVRESDVSGHARSSVTSATADAAESDEEMGYRPIFAFDTDEPEFSRGFEAGKLYATIGDSLFGVSELENAGFVIHHTNTELVMRMAEKFNLSFTATEIDDEFTSVALTPKGDSA